MKKRKHIPLSREDRAARKAEKAQRMKVEAQAIEIESKRIGDAKANALDVLDRRSAKWGEVACRWDRERQDEAAAAKAAAKERRRRARAGLPNAAVDPVSAQTITGERVIVDRLSGRFNLMVNRSDWPRELAEACQRFEHDYQLSMSGIRGQSLEPHVDGGRSAQNTSQIEALQRVQMIQARIDPEDYAPFVLWAGLGVSITAMHSKRWGVKDELGRRIKRAASHAAAFYHSGFSTKPSWALREMHDYIALLTR